MPGDAPKHQFAEFIAMVCFVGTVVGIGVVGYTFALDWQRGHLKAAREYGRMAIVVSGPFVAGIVGVAVYFRLRK